MHAPVSSPNSRRSRKIRLIASGAILFILFLGFVHPFLAITEPVKADVIVVEGWVPNYVLPVVVSEFNRGGYTRVLVSGLEFTRNDPAYSEGSDAARTARRLASLGLDPAVVLACPAPDSDWNRTSTMARTVLDRLHTLNVQPKGINVITLGPHARQSRLAYQRIAGPLVPVGVISVPKDDYVASHWWTSPAGIKKTIKDFAGWAKEFLVGPRS